MMADSGSDAMLGQFSRLVLGLYDDVPRLSPDCFQEAALVAARSSLGFDSALWATAAMGPEGPFAHSVHLHRLPPELACAYEVVKGDDHLARAAAARPGATIAIDALAGPLFAGVESQREHCRRFGMAHILCTMQIHPYSGLLEFISLYRADPDRPYGEHERRFKEALVPHMIRAFHSCQMQAMTSTLERRETGVPAAVADVHGVLSLVEDDFVTLLRSEWPDWRGPRLPQDLYRRLSGRVNAWPVGARLAAASRSLASGLFLITLRPLVAADHLSARERQVAAAYAGGAQYKVIARELGVSPATVRNQLRNIFGKLGVSNKAEMIRALRAA